MDFQNELYKISASNGKVSVWSAWTNEAEVIITFGTQDGKQQQKTYTAKGKNQGKANETTGAEQALIELAAMYVKQRKNKHYRDTVEEAQALLDTCTVPRKVHNFKNDGHKIVYPCYASKKLDGSRANVQNNVLYSKAGLAEVVKVPHIAAALKKWEEYEGSITFDSEVYAHGLSLQRIRSAWTKPNRTAKELETSRKKYFKDRGITDEGQPMPYSMEDDVKSLKLYVFDTSEQGVLPDQRMHNMYDMQATVEALGLDEVIKFIFPEVINSAEEGRELRDEAVLEGYEGLVYMNFDDMIINGIRSYSCQKDKPRLDTECRVLSVVKDKNGEGVITVRACDKLDNVEFSCKMKVERRDGKRYERTYEAMLDLIGKWVTVSYENLSDKGCPCKPVGEEERKCNDAGDPLE